MDQNVSGNIEPVPEPEVDERAGVESSIDDYCNADDVLCSTFLSMNFDCPLLIDIKELIISRDQYNNILVFKEFTYNTRKKNIYFKSPRGESGKTIITFYKNRGENINDLNHLLVYFHGKGRAQAIRDILFSSDIGFIDIQIELDFWNERLKPDSNFYRCFPPDGFVPKMYLKYNEIWKIPNFLKESCDIITYLLNYNGEIIDENHKFNEKDLFINKLIKASDQLKGVYYELSYKRKRTKEGIYKRVKLSEEETKVNVQEWIDTPHGIINIPENIDKLLNSIIEGNPPFGSVVTSSRSRGLILHPNNFSVWMYAIHSIVNFIWSLRYFNIINERVYNGLLLIYNDSLELLKNVVVKPIKGEANLNEYIPINLNFNAKCISGICSEYGVNLSGERYDARTHGSTEESLLNQVLNHPTKQRSAPAARARQQSPRDRRKRTPLAVSEMSEPSLTVEPEKGGDDDAVASQAAALRELGGYFKKSKTKKKKYKTKKRKSRTKKRKSKTKSK